MAGMGRTTLLGTLAVAAALVVAPPALAKGPFEVCGASGCAVIAPETQLPIRLSVDAATPTVPPTAPAPYFVVRLAHFDGVLAYWVPSASVLRLLPQNWPAVWVAPLPGEDALLREKTAGLEPYPAPAHATAYVDYNLAKRGGTYLRLFTIGAPLAGGAPATAAWLAVWLRGGHSPWNDGTASLEISRTGNLLRREGQVLQIPAALARRIRAGLPLA